MNQAQTLGPSTLSQNPMQQHMDMQASAISNSGMVMPDSHHMLEQQNWIHCSESTSNNQLEHESYEQSVSGHVTPREFTANSESLDGSTSPFEANEFSDIEGLLSGIPNNIDNGELLLAQTTAFPGQNSTPEDSDISIQRDSDSQERDITMKEEHDQEQLSPSLGSYKSQFSALENTPYGVPFAIDPAEIPREAFSRRGSIVSDLATTINGMPLPSQNNSDEEIFKTPTLPQRESLAARRHRRPVALDAIRTASASGLYSPPSRDGSLTLQPRKSRSMGTSLNANVHRVHKSGTVSAQRSPLRANFLTNNYDHSNISQMASNGLLNDPNDAFNPFRETATGSTQLQSFEKPCSSNSPSENIVPPLSTTYTCEDRSPPITPLHNHNFAGSWPTQSLPQSAPPLVTEFPHHSPPMMAHNGNINCFSPQPQHPYNPLLGQVHAFMPPVVPMDMNVYGSEQQPQISRPSSLGSQITFSAALPNAESQKTIEFASVYAYKGHLLLPCNPNGSVSFQNHTAKDFINKD
jgi:hypothetical protein